MGTQIFYLSFCSDIQGDCHGSYLEILQTTSSKPHDEMNLNFM